MLTCAWVLDGLLAVQADSVRASAVEAVDLVDARAAGASCVSVG